MQVHTGLMLIIEAGAETLRQKPQLIVRRIEHLSAEGEGAAELAAGDAIADQRALRAAIGDFQPLRIISVGDGGQLHGFIAHDQ